ncbi:MULTISPECIES: hypothetical protein [Nocardiaceae]|jgi:hypothetical protein|uniref:hypothetical protein n=1 Tax=Nocardiaceae TaxID=85025 RepID=UPI001E2BCE0B|nr:MULTISPECIES: hypothetical protein [Rhodococcus]MCC8929631.1 hypothetical protein [Rhodococcus sp. I2R]MCZ4276868.1 hypothetical protein [Rhodococcus yunnanensis]
MALSVLDRKLIVWSALFVVSQANIVRLLGPAGPKVLQVQTAWSERRYREILASMGDAETARFRSHYFPDLVHPAIYAMALRAGARSLTAKASLNPESVPGPATVRALAVAPVVSAACDYIENIVGLTLVDNRNLISDKVVRSTTVVSTVKWVTAAGSLAYLSQGFVRHWRRNLLG